MIETEQTDLTETEETGETLETLETVPRDGRLYVRASRVVAVVPWRSTFREFLVVVAGILSALGAQALWTRHDEQQKEHDYLRQLAADTRENQQRVASAIAHENIIRIATFNLMTVLEGTDPLPPTDSMTHWLGATAGASDFRPLLGTYRALVSTGDLRLIRNDSLRVLLAEYSAEVENESERLRELRNVVIAQAAPIGRAIPFIRHVFIEHTPKDAIDGMAHLRDTQEPAIVIFTLQAANNNRLNGLNNVQAATTRLRKALEAEPSLRSGP